MSYRVLIVEDHPAMRQGFESLIAFEDDFVLTASVRTAEEALPLVAQDAPDVVLVDLQLPGMTGIDFVERVRALPHPVRAVIVSAHEEEVYAERAVKSGAYGYLMKRDAARRVAGVLREVARGRVYLSTPMWRQVLASWLEHEGASMSPDDPSDDEIEVFERSGQGVPDAEIAEVLGVDPARVGDLRARMSDRMAFVPPDNYDDAARRWLSSVTA